MTADRIVRLDQVRDVASVDIPETPPHSWQTLNLVELAANPPEPPTIGGLLYPGKRTVLSGETESMKTWFALILAKAELDAGYPVVWVDLDAMGPGAMLNRLELLAVNRHQIASNFHYIEPSDPLDPAKIAELVDTIAQLQARLCVIDAFNPILNLQGLNPNEVIDIETFWRTIADPICRAGAAPVLLDHVVKNPDNRGKYASGSERKASGSIVHLGFKLLVPLRKGGIGSSVITVHKDRPGYLTRPAIGRLVLDATEHIIQYKIEPDKSHDPKTGDTRHTVYMERISRALEIADEPAPKSWIEENVEGKGQFIRIALGELIEDGYVTAEKGARNATLHTLIRPFREADVAPTSSSSPVRPDLVPDLTSRPVRPSSPPVGDEDALARRPEDEHELVPAGQPLPDYDLPPIDESLAPDDLDDQPSDDIDWSTP